MKPDSSGVIACVYRCRDDDCDFAGDANNGVGLAAQHKEANPDHEVVVEQTIHYLWE